MTSGRPAPIDRPSRAGLLDGIRVLLFDVPRTLIDWETSMACHLTALWSTIGTGSEQPGLADEWRFEFERLSADIAAGRREVMPPKVLRRESLVAVLKRRRIHGLGEGLIDELVDLWDQARLWPEAGDALGRLRERAILAAVDHGNGNQSRLVAADAGIQWDLIFTPAMVGIHRPSPEVFLRALCVGGVRRDEIMLISSRARDLESAADGGFRTALVHRSRPTGRSPQRATLPPVETDLACGDLTSLADELEPPDPVPSLTVVGSPTTSTVPAATTATTATTVPTGTRSQSQRSDPSSSDRHPPTPVPSIRPRPRVRRPRSPRGLAILFSLIIAACSALAFGQGYRLGHHRGASMPPDQVATDQQGGPGRAAQHAPSESTVRIGAPISSEDSVLLNDKEREPSAVDGRIEGNGRPVPALSADKPSGQ